MTRSSALSRIRLGHILLALSLVGLTLLVAFCVSDRTAARRPAAVVDQLTFSRHGILASPDAQEQLERIRSNPLPYIREIERRLVLPTDLRVLTSDSVKQPFVNAIDLLVAIDDSTGLEVAARVEDAVAQYVRTEWTFVRDSELGLRPDTPPVARLFIEIQRRLLQNFAAIGDRRLVPRALELVERADYSTAIAALQYLATVAPGDQIVIEGAHAAVNAPRSAVVADPTATVLLEHLVNGTFRQRAGR